LTPANRTQPEYEDSEKPSFENFLSQPTTLSDHLAWQLGALSLASGLRRAAELVIGNLDEDGYLAASDEELAAALGQFDGSWSSDNGAHGNGVSWKSDAWEWVGAGERSSGAGRGA